MKESIELSEDHTDMVKYERRPENGCHIGLGSGIILALLVIAISVGVGLLVYFVGGSCKAVTCHCGHGAGSTDDQSARAKFWSQCQAEVENRDFCLVSGCSGPSTKTPTTKPTSSDLRGNFRLPKALFPVTYDLELKPYIYNGQPSTFTFEGHVTILVNCSESTRNITLHILDLSINNQSLSLKETENEASAMTIRYYDVDTRRQFLILYLTEALQPGHQYSLSMNFTGILKEDLKGFYMSSYKRENKSVYMAVSMFAPTDARKAFPCFDEPAMKAEFNLVIVRKPPLMSLTNMPISRNETRPDGFVADIYDTSPKMSTYLLAFVVCDFEHKERSTSSGVKFRVWSRPEALDQVDYALSVGVRVLEYFEDYFQIPYPLPKQDMIAIPDFAAGAMENWGLITYKEASLLFDPASSTDYNRQFTAVIVAHELAHQWFGNLVTPSWWDDVWLNEGFASFVEYMGVNAIHEDWKMFEQFVTSDLQPVFSLDGLGTSHPIYQSVNHPDEVSEIFDGISYAKGASVIRMMRYFLGEETFRKGLTRYLRDLAYEAAFHDDLWSHLRWQSREDGNETDVKTIMDTWTLQMNYPVVTVTRTANNDIQLQQSRFLVQNHSADNSVVSPFGYRWEIPFTYTSSLERDFEHHRIDYLHKDGEMVTLSHPNIPSTTNVNSWVIGNIKQYGYYRVNYDAANWNALIYQLKTNHKVIHTINRAQLINDAWNLAKSSLLNQTTALRILEYLEREEDFIPWKAALVGLGFVDSMLSQSGIYGDFRTFMKRSVTPLYQKLGYNNTNAVQLDSYLRSTILSQACKYDMLECVRPAQQLFAQWMNDSARNPIESWQKETVYCTAIRYGGLSEWDFTYRIYKESNLASEKARLLQALSCTKDTWILGRYLQRTMVSEEIRTQDAVNSIIHVSNNAAGRYLAWRFVQERWDEIKLKYGSGIFAFSRLITGITANFNTALDLKQLESFLVDHPDQGTAARAFKQSVERTKSNIKWMDQNENIIADWLRTSLSR